MPEIRVPLRAPELAVWKEAAEPAAAAWLQGPPVRIRGVDGTAAGGRVALVEFWESTCVNCLRTLPYLHEWHRRYASRGLVVVGVHTPEFEMARRPEVVAEAVRREGIPYPVLLDPDAATWTLFANKYWPARYLVDAGGYLRYEHFGEGAYVETERTLQALLREAGDRSPMPSPMSPLRPEDRPGAVCLRPTAELHLGYHRGRMIGPRPYRPGEEVDHPASWTLPPPDGAFTPRGRWFHAAEYLESRSPDATLELLATAATVNLVGEPPSGQDARLEIHYADAPTAHHPETWKPLPPALAAEDVVITPTGQTVTHWTHPRLLHLLTSQTLAPHRLRLTLQTPGTRLYALSFTGCVQP